jgi:1-acyl-sn-glycerol-3-phosphate acyltransferase
VAFVASTDLQAHRIFGVFLRRLGCVFVERESATASSTALEEMTDTLLGKRRLAVFPEGSIGSGLRPFHLGAFGAAVTAARPVIPVGIRGTDGVLSPGRYRPRRHAVTVSIGPPLSVDDEGFEAEIKLRDASQKAVVRLSANLT